MTFYPSITNTILTQWIVIAFILVAAIVMTPARRSIPGRAQNAFETFYETLGDFGLGWPARPAAPYIPIFAAFFLLILFSNWIGLLPLVGRVEWLRAPSSDVNITLGLALVAFLIFEGEGFRKLGVRGYLGKFFPLYEFKKGIGAGVSRCSSAWSSSCSSSSSPSRSRCDSSATSTAARSRSASSPA